MDFVFGKLEEESDISTPGGRAKAMRSALELIYPLRASYMIDSYYMQIADRLGLDVDTIRASAGKVFREVQQREETARRREKQRERAQSSPPTPSRPQALPRLPRPAMTRFPTRRSLTTTSLWGSRSGAPRPHGGRCRSRCR
ncbi:MAG: hypothetical protein ACLTSX_14715 [Collinsella sp.]